MSREGLSEVSVTFELGAKWKTGTSHIALRGEHSRDRLVGTKALWQKGVWKKTGKEKNKLKTKFVESITVKKE